MADDKSLNIGINVDAAQAISEQERYNRKLQEMAQRQEEAATATKHAADAAAYAALKSELRAKALEKEVAGQARLAANAKEAAAANEELKKTTKTYGEADVKAALDGEQATGKAISAKKQFKDAIQGVASQFPGLAAAARLALNPITLSIASISTAAVILYDKLKPIGEVFQSSAWEPSKINKTAEAWERTAAAVALMASNASQLKTDLDAIAQKSALIDKILGDNSNPLVAKKRAEEAARRTNAEVANKRITADALRKAAGGIKTGGSDDEDAGILGSLQNEAAGVAPKIAELDKEIAEIEFMIDPASSKDIRNIPSLLASGGRFASKYGAFTSETDILEQLRSQRGGYQSVVDRARNFEQSAGTRSAQRKTRGAMLSRANALDSEASTLHSQGEESFTQAGVDFGMAMRGRGITPRVTSSGEGFGESPEVRKRIDQANANAEAIAKQFEVGMASLLSSITATNKKVDAQAAASANHSTNGGM